MNVFQVKVYMLKKGLTIVGMARELCEESETKETSMTTMISDLIHGRRYYPDLAKKLDHKFGIKLTRPEHLAPVREIVRKTAQKAA